METISKSVTSSYVINGTIQGSQINITYNQTGTDKPSQINANCVIIQVISGGTGSTQTQDVNPPIMPPMMMRVNNDNNTNINMTMYNNGQKTTSISGKLKMEETASILSEMEIELNAIFSQFTV